MPDYIITAVRTIRATQRAAIVMSLADASEAPTAESFPDDAWTIDSIAQVSGANIQSVLEWNDPQGRLESVTGAVRVGPTPHPLRDVDFVTDTRGVTTDIRLHDPAPVAPPAAKSTTALVVRASWKTKPIPVHAVGDAN